jgi:hypothetical protein
MCKKIYLMITLVLLLTAVNPVFAQEGDTDPHWQASYWNNTSLSGTPALQRQETDLDYDWGTGSPDGSVSSDSFSARWTKYIDVTAGTYRFTATSDDGIKVWVDNGLIIDQWNDHATSTFTADRYLSAGHHWIVIEFYENAGAAVAKLSWAPVTVISEWRGEYFDNKTLSGSPALIRNDAQIDFDWGVGSPASGIGDDNFSVRWTRDLDLPAGRYQFKVTVDDGVRLWVNGHLLIESWRDQPPTTYTGNIYLPGGAVPVKMEYYEKGGGATARLSWSSGGSQPEGTVIVDNDDAGFVKGGSYTSWRTVYEGYKGSLLWTRNNDKVRTNYNWARWYPSLAARRYEVFVYIPYRYTTTANARYWVKHAGGYTLRVVDQSRYNNEWVSLGTYWFSGSSEEYVSLADVTYEPYVSRLIAFDAVKWEPR